MPFELRLLIVSLAAFAWAGAAGTLLAAWLWRRPASGSAAERAARLLRLRLLPIALGASATALAIVSFLLYEPRHIDETTGWVMTGLAVAGAALLLTAVWRSARIALATRRAWRGWQQTAVPAAIDDLGVPAFLVTSAFPVVAVVGFWRPRLVIARSVLAACTADELHAILRHERHHLERRDNLRRAVLALAPDLLGLLPASRRWLRAWHEATEEAADDFARRSGDHGGVVLAQALLKVARLTPAGSAAASLPASALYRGENLERRVRRLLQPATEVSGGRRRISIAAVAAAASATGLLGLERIHQLVETAVNTLP
jgi:hypothetical protein